MPIEAERLNLITEAYMEIGAGNYQTAQNILYKERLHDDNNAAIEFGLLLIKATCKSILDICSDDIPYSIADKLYADTIEAFKHDIAPELLELIIKPFYKFSKSYILASGKDKNNSTVLFYRIYKIFDEANKIEMLEPIFDSLVDEILDKECSPNVRNYKEREKVTKRLYDIFNFASADKQTILLIELDSLVNEKEKSKLYLNHIYKDLKGKSPEWKINFISDRSESSIDRVLKDDRGILCESIINDVIKEIDSNSKDISRNIFNILSNQFEVLSKKFVLSTVVKLFEYNKDDKNLNDTIGKIIRAGIIVNDDEYRQLLDTLFDLKPSLNNDPLALEYKLRERYNISNLSELDNIIYKDDPDCLKYKKLTEGRNSINPKSFDFNDDFNINPSIQIRYLKPTALELALLIFNSVLMLGWLGIVIYSIIIKNYIPVLVGRLIFIPIGLISCEFLLYKYKVDNLCFRIVIYTLILIYSIISTSFDRNTEPIVPIISSLIIIVPFVWSIVLIMNSLIDRYSLDRGRKEKNIYE